MASTLSWGETSLLLATPFSGLATFARVSISLALFAVGFALLTMLYRAESKLIPRRFAIALLTLRLLVFAVILATLLFDPILSKTVSEEVPGRVIVALDTSDSMRISDAHRTIREKMHVARKLKLIPELASDGLLRDYESRSLGADPPPFLGGTNDPDRKKFDEVLAKLDSTTRLHQAIKVLTPEGLDIAKKIQSKHTVDLLGFDQELSFLALETNKLAASVRPEALGSTRTTVPTYTDLKLPLARATESVGDSVDAVGPRLVGVVLLTDGRHNWGEIPAARVAELAARQVPIYPVLIGSKDPPPDVAITSAQAQSATVFKGSIVPVEVAVRVTGTPQGNITVTLTPPNGGPPITDSILHRGPDNTYNLSLKVKLDEPGPQNLSITAKADVGTDTFPENNTRNARVNVVKDRAKVMIIDGEARWEFHYLQTCLGRDPNMDVRSIVFRQPRLNRVSEDELKKMGTPARKMPDDVDVLSSYDCVVLGDAEPAQLGPEWRERLEKYVAEAGGTLVIVAGKRAMPTGYMDNESDPIRRMMPIKNLKIINSDEGFRLGVTQEGDRSWFLAMGDTPTESRRTWGRFPLHYWAVVGTAKDGAEVLATAPGGAAKDNGIIVRQNYGFGRVLYVGIDSTWRWRFKTGDYFHHRFWGQVAQWAASDKLLPTSNADGTIRFGTREPTYKPGQDVEVVVRAAESIKKLGAGSLKGARVIRIPDKPEGREVQGQVAQLEHPEARPRDLVGKLKDLLPGRYAVELDIPEWADKLQGPPGPDGRFGPLRAYFEVLPPENEELIDVAGNEVLLEQMAKETGGRMFTVEDVEELPDVLAKQVALREYRVDRPLRRSWWPLGLIVLLLSCEWGLRKWAGLP